MNNRDRHRLLLPVVSHVNIKGIEVEDETGERHIGSGVSAELQKPPYCIRYRRGLHATNKGELIMIEDVESEHRLPVLETISGYSYYVARVVKLFEAFLELEGF